MRRRPARILRRCDGAGRPFRREASPPDGDADPAAAAFEEGRRQGFDEGVAQAKEEFERLADSLRNELSESLRRLARLEEERTAELESLLAELAMEAATAIVRERIERGDPVAARALEEAIGSLPSSVTLRVRLNPGDLEAARGTLGEETARGRIELIADESIVRGGCRVESDRGGIDATVETAQAQVRRAITGEGEAG